MIKSEIALRRLSQQQLLQPTCTDPAAVVWWLGAVQAQDYAGAKWALGLRMQHATDAMIERAFDAGTILRTHVMRPTWHFVAPADIRWLLALTAPRIHALNAYMYRKLDLDAALFARSNDVIARALQGGRHLTREELGVALAEAGIAANGMRLGYIVHHAELDAVVCSGPRRGKQFTYALLDERAPQAQTRPRDEALARLTRSYFTSHGPATPADFVWWSSLTMADARAGIEMVRSELVSEVADGQTLWFSPSALSAEERSPQALLLPNYDEYFSYADRSAIFDPQHLPKMNPQEHAVFNHIIVIDGQVAGTWKRTFEKGAVVVTVNPFTALTGAARDAVAIAARRYGTFLGMPVTLVSE